MKALECRAFCHEVQQHYEAAITDYEKALDLKPSAETQQRLQSLRQLPQKRKDYYEILGMNWPPCFVRHSCRLELKEGAQFVELRANAWKFICCRILGRDLLIQTMTATLRGATGCPCPGLFALT